MHQVNIECANKKIAIWLFVCSFMVLVMVTVGGLTRLTGSGLSMTNWQPVVGALPPLSQSAWEKEFSNYKQSPEFKQVNNHMGLAEFKNIFWLEYIHRLLGRLTGFIFLIPLIIFSYRKYFSKNLFAKLSLVFIFGGIQAIIGWYMVKSGLKDVPRVSHLWLAFHLLSALIIFSAIFLLALGQYKFTHSNVSNITRNIYIALTSCVVVQIILGAFVAGLDAGLIYNSFPDMNGSYIPDDIMFLSPWYKNFIYNATTIQFMHRIMAYVICLLIIAFYLVSKRDDLSQDLEIARGLLIFVVIGQFLLGVLTLLTKVTITLASLHQVTAFILFAIILYIGFNILRVGNFRLLSSDKMKLYGYNEL